MQQKGSNINEELNLLTHLGRRKNCTVGGLTWLDSLTPLQLWALDVQDKLGAGGSIGFQVGPGSAG